MPTAILVTSLSALGWRTSSDHLATNSSNEEDAERGAHKFRINKHHYRLLAKGVSVCALLCFASLTLTAQQTQEVKTKQVGRLENLFVIEVGVGGKPRHFIVDTGASMTMVSKQVGQSTLVVQKYNVVNSTGHDSSVDVARIEMTIGSTKTLTDAFVSDMDAVSRASGMKIDGIVGQDLLSQFKTVTFNYRTKTITFVSR